MFNELFLWTNVVLLCAFILLMQIARIVVPLFSARQPLWKYALVVFALMLSLSSFAFAIHIMSVGQSFFAITGTHLSPSFYMYIKAQLFNLTVSCIRQICLIALMFVLTWCVTRTIKIRSEPAWVLAQDIRVRL